MSPSTLLNSALGLEPQYRPYVWGGNRLRPGKITAEAWVVYEGNRITSGPMAGHTLAETAAEFGPALLGQRVFARTGVSGEDMPGFRFPEVPGPF